MARADRALYQASLPRVPLRSAMGPCADASWPRRSGAGTHRASSTWSPIRCAT